MNLTMQAEDAKKFKVAIVILIASAIVVCAVAVVLIFNNWPQSSLVQAGGNLTTTTLERHCTTFITHPLTTEDNVSMILYLVNSTSTSCG
jgi:flagellar basal body-associated protein FliL